MARHYLASLADSVLFPLLAATLLLTALAPNAQPLGSLEEQAQARVEHTADARMIIHAVAAAYPETQETKLTTSDTAALDQFGTSVSISSNFALVGAPGGNGGGRAYVFTRTSTGWEQDAKLTAGDAATFDRFGTSVSISGDRALVGAPGDDDDGITSGSAYVFVRTATGWAEEAKLTASDAAPRDVFGTSVSISGDRALVGASGESVGGASGYAYVFVRTATGWTEEAKLTASDAALGDRFGYSVSLSGDHALVGAYYDDDGFINSGSAYVFVRSGNAWAQEAKLNPSDAAEIGLFGYSVSLSGERALVSSFGGSGAAYVFVQTPTGWAQEAKLGASDLALGSFYGVSVSLSDDRAIVGASGDDDGLESSGSAYVFARTETGWTQMAKLGANDAAELDRFGVSVALSDDLALVGVENVNSAYVFASSSGATPVEDAPSVASVSPVRPNPVAAQGAVRLLVAAPEPVRASLYDALGREVAVVFDGVASGSVALHIEGSSLASGPYILRVVGATFAESRRLTVVR